MRQVLTIVLILLVASAVFAAKPDSRDGIPESSARIDIPGYLDSTDPLLDRWRPNDYQAVSLDCMLPMEYHYSSQPYYHEYCVMATDTQPIEIWTVYDLTDFDTVLYLYCDPFDPANTTDNCVIFDDDDGEGLMSMFGVWDNLTLTPNIPYFLIICSYSGGYTGDYVIQTSENVMLCSTPVERSDWSAIKTLYR